MDAFYLTLRMSVKAVPKKSPVPETESEEEFIRIYGAREHNLHNLTLSIPREKLVVITGLSGSGKSSLAFDTLHAEGQRRYMETFSAYARQFMGNLERPDVDAIEGLSPVIAIEQKTTNRNPRSTVGTVTEVYDFLRLLYARASTAYSQSTGEAMVSYTDAEIFDRVLETQNGETVAVLAPVVRSRKGHYRELFESMAKQGFLRARVNGVLVEITRGMKLDRYKTHDIEVVIDRLVVESDKPDRLRQALQLGLKHGKGSVGILHLASNKLIPYSRHLMCPTSGEAAPEPEPNTFSFNSPKGACPQCHGLGEVREVDLDRLVPNPKKSIKEGALAPLAEQKKSWIHQQLEWIGLRFGFDLNTPWEDLPEAGQAAILYGIQETFEVPNKAVGVTRRLKIDYEGIIPFLNTMATTEGNRSIQRWAEEYLVDRICPSCSGQRLRSAALQFKVAGKTIAELANWDLASLAHWLDTAEAELPSAQQKVGAEIFKELRTRIGFLNNVGLTYLALNRPSRSLSGGEAQRIRLATQIGSQLMNVLYILDEPSIGLHQRDNQRLIESLQQLRDVGNTVLVVEHDLETMKAADHIIDMGPRAGIHGGRIVAQGTFDEVAAAPTLTGAFLRGEAHLPVPLVRRPGNGTELVLEGATGNNLHNVTLRIPLGTWTSVTGVSGSGKSTLVNETLYPLLAAYCYNALDKPLPYRAIRGLELLDKVIDVDQSPIGRTPRSNPATYTGLFNEIRNLFAQLPEAKIRGYAPGRFSFNVKGGRCQVCEGDGMRSIEMNFLPDVYVPCEGCRGKRFNRETLEVRYKGKSISDVLEMSVEDAVQFFENLPKTKRILQTLYDVGLGYLTLGQSSTTLSGGEAQRVKLATELCKKDTGRTLYILDEPSTGLHFEDVRILAGVLQRLVGKGNTLILIEHNTDLIEQSDWVVDMGPEGGSGGGRIVAEGTPEKLAKDPNSTTGRYLSGGHSTH